MSSDSKYFSTIIGYIVPFGSHHDAVGKEGLANILVDSYNYGTTRYPEATKLFIELEKTGAVFSSEAGREDIYIYLSVPRENQKDARKLLDHIVEEVETTQKNLDKIKRTIGTKREEIMSDDRNYAEKVFSEMIYKERPLLGNEDSFKNITLNDLKNVQREVIKKKVSFQLNGPDDMEVEDKDYTHVKGGLAKTDLDPIRLLTRDIEQKVLYLGYKTKGFSEQPHVVRRVASSIIYSGLTGMAMDRIRHKLSAAYYVAYRHDVISDSGAAYMFAGLSEKNIPLVAEIMLQIYRDVMDGKYTDDMLEMAKAYFKGNLDRGYDSPNTLASLYLSYVTKGLPIPRYDDIVREIDKVSKADISVLFGNMLKVEKPIVVVNGTLSSQTQVNLKKVIEDV